MPTDPHKTFEALRAPFLPEEHDISGVEVGSDGVCNPYTIYVDFNALCRRFDSVFGPDGWDYVVEPVDGLMRATVTVYISGGHVVRRTGVYSWAADTVNGLDYIGSQNGKDLRLTAVQRYQNNVKSAHTLSVRHAFYNFGLTDYFKRTRFIIDNVDAWLSGNEAANLIMEDISYENH